MNITVAQSYSNFSSFHYYYSNSFFVSAFSASTVAAQRVVGSTACAQISFNWANWRLSLLHAHNQIPPLISAHQIQIDEKSVGRRRRRRWRRKIEKQYIRVSVSEHLNFRMRLCCGVNLIRCQFRRSDWQTNAAAHGNCVTSTKIVE